MLLATTCNKKALRFEIEFCEEEQIVFHGKFIALLLLSSCDFGMVNVSIQHFSSLASTEGEEGFKSLVKKCHFANVN